MRRVAPLLPFATLAAGPASAHAFMAGSEGYAAFLEGARVPLNDPMILLPLVSAGVTIGIWQREGMPRVWPGLLAGLAGGLALAPLAPPAAALAALLLAVVTAVMGVAAMRWPRGVILPLVTLTGALCGAASLEGHDWGALPLTVLLGVFFGANLALVLPAGLVAVSRDHLKGAWLLIGWRVVASWVGAVAMMLAALQFA